MVLDEPLEVNDDLVPSFNNSDSSLRSRSERSEEAVSILKDYEETVVPNIIELNWMSEVAKSRSKPYYNKTDQNINGHIFPGVEVIADIVENLSSIDDKEIRDLISLWTVHDIHKVIHGEDDEFSISKKQVSEIVSDLGLEDFNENLSVSDYHSCSVALHNSNPSKIDDSTTRFTQLRPILRLTDLVNSISDPSEFTEQAERLVMKVFGTDENPYVPGSHTLNINDSVIQKIVNKSVYTILKNKGYKPIDIRENGVMYVRPQDHKELQNPEFMQDVVSLTFSNMRQVYQHFSNRSLLGSNIENPQTRSNYNKPPRVYDVSTLSKVCLSKEEIVQRIVQAAVEHQNRPYELPKESESQIDNLNAEIDALSIDKSMFVEGMAALVHTFYKDVLPEMILSDSKYAFERTLEGSVLHLFECSDETQEVFLKAMKSDSIHSSTVEWPYKYIIAQELHEEYSVEYSRTERRDIMAEMILERMQMFDEWDNYIDEDFDGIWDEFYTRIASSLSVNNQNIMEYPDVKVIDKLNSHRNEGKCSLCGTITSESPLTPSILSNNNFDILDEEFSTSDGSELVRTDLESSIPKNPICSICQFGLSARSQQINHGMNDSDRSIHVSIYPMNSGSVASITRFNKVLQILRTHVFADKSSLYNSELASEYQDVISDYLSHTKNLNAITDRERLLSVTSSRDAVTSNFELPNRDQETVTKSICCIATAAMVAGVRVCVTNHSQVNIPYNNIESILNISNELEFFDDLLQSSSSIENLINELKIADRVIRVGSEVNSVSSVMNYYDGIEDKDILVGSQLYDQIEHMMTVSTNPMKIVKNCVNLDAIVSHSDGYSMNILSKCSGVSTSLTEVINSGRVQHILDSVDVMLDIVFSIKDDISKNRVYKALDENSDELEHVKLGQLEKRTCTDQLCYRLSNLSREFSNRTEHETVITNKRRSLIKSCVKLQVLLKGDIHG